MPLHTKVDRWSRCGITYTSVCSAADFPPYLEYKYASDKNTKILTINEPRGRGGGWSSRNLHSPLQKNSDIFLNNFLTFFWNYYISIDFSVRAAENFFCNYSFCLHFLSEPFYIWSCHLATPFGWESFCILKTTLDSKSHP